MGAGVSVGTAVGSETGVGVEVDVIEGVLLGSGVWAESSEPPQPIRNNVARTITTVEKNLTVQHTRI